MNLQSVLFFILLVVFVIGIVVIFMIKKFRTFTNCFLLICILVALVYISQRDGALSYKIGPFLEAKLQKGPKDLTNFEIKNPGNESVQETIRLFSGSEIKNVSFDKGNDFFSILDGGVGNNYIVYNVDIPPNQIASFSMASADTVIAAPVFKKRDLKDQK